MATGNSGSISTPVKTRREELGAATAFLQEKDPILCTFRDIGDRFSGRIVGAKIVPNEIGGQQKKNAAGMDKNMLQLYLTSDDGDKLVLNIQSQNQKQSVNDALAAAGVTGLAAGDHFLQEYVGNDEALREGLSAARRFNTVIVPGE
jgi:hypothetical protein